MSRFATKEAMISDAAAARVKLDQLLAAMPEQAKLVEVVDGWTAKDLIAHRTEWGRMMLRWYAEARLGHTPAVPAEGHTWSTLHDLNAEIRSRFSDERLTDVESEFTRVHDDLFVVMAACTEDELFTKRYYTFTGTSDLATYFTSATGGHYRSAYKHINRWWRANRDAYPAD